MAAFQYAAVLETSSSPSTCHYLSLVPLDGVHSPALDAWMLQVLDRHIGVWV